MPHVIIASILVRLTQITQLLHLPHIGLGGISRACWTLILHCPKHRLIHQHLLRAQPLPAPLNATSLAPRHSSHLRGRRRH